MKAEFFKDKNVLIMGLGRFGGGADAAKFAAAQGSKVTVTDLAAAEQLDASIEELAGISNIEFRLGSHEKSDFERADVVVVNPAVAPENEFIDIARRAGATITSQIAIFFELCPARTIGITGANGKSTTAALTAHILTNAKPANVISRSKATKQSPTARYAIPDTRYEQVFLSGNIGNRPLLGAIDSIGENDVVVLELSSFQLEQLAGSRIAPNVALLTNLTPNHLDRHGTFAEYCAAKENIFKFQKTGSDTPAVSIFNA
ncbi:MAG: Mur ligase family protein, partial [Planctomycetota bacterium]